MIINHVLLALLLGIATYALSDTVTGHEGPFHSFDRLRNWLLPKKLRPIPFNIDEELVISAITDLDIQDGYYTLIGNYLREKEFIISILEYDDGFNNSLRGNMFNVLNCKYCFGVCAALFLALPLVFIFFGFSVTSAIVTLLHWWVAIGIQRLIITLVD